MSIQNRQNDVHMNVAHWVDDPVVRACSDGANDEIALMMDDSPHLRCKFSLLHYKLALKTLQVV